MRVRFLSHVHAHRRLSFEQLLRKLLAMPGRPAVLLLHWWSPYINRHAFFATAEDGINTIAAYYGAPVQRTSRSFVFMVCMQVKAQLRPSATLTACDRPASRFVRYHGAVVHPCCA